MLRLRLTQLLLVGAAVFAAANPALAQNRAARNARAMMESVNRRYFDLFNKGDVAAFAQVYSADAIQLPPNAPAIRGREAIRSAWQRGWDAGVRNVRVTVVEASVHGNEATEYANWELDLVRPDGSMVGTDRGKVVVLWKREPSGEWRWHRDIYSSDMPAQPMAGGLPRAATGDSVWVIVQAVKPDKRADFEQFVHTFWGAGLRSSDARTREVFEKTRALFPSQAGADGRFTYVFIMDPVVSGGNYSIDELSRQLFGATEGPRVTALFSGALVEGQTGYRLVEAARTVPGTP